MAANHRKRQQGIAAVVTVAGVLGMSAWAMHRQSGQTEALSRVWVGQQWDVARDCFVGTPIGRGEGEAAIAARLEARLLETLVDAASDANAADTDALWPARCVGTLASLHVDRSLLAADPGDALTTLEVLAPRVLGDVPDGPAAWSLGERRARVLELAPALARLDIAMPSGAEYDRRPPPRYAAIAASVVASLECPPASRPTRPFFEARAGGVRLLDEDLAGGRITLDEGELLLSRAGESGVEERVLTPPAAGVGAPRFFRDGVVWASSTSASLRIEARDGSSVEVTLPLESPVVALAPCESTIVSWLSVAVADGGAFMVQLAGAEVASVHPITPTPPDSGVRQSCSATRAALMWLGEGGRWRGSVCDADGCSALPVLDAGGDLQLAMNGDTFAVHGRGARTDLALSRRLEGTRWGAPTLSARGRFTAAVDGFQVESCESVLTWPTGTESWARP